MRSFVFLFSLAAWSANPPARFEKHVIAEDLKGGYQVVAADLNRDGRPDLIALASGIPDLVWFENPGWQRHVLFSGLRQMINLAVLDSGEIVIAHEFSNEAKKSLGIVSVLTPGPDRTKPWTIREIDRVPTAHRLRTANLDGTGQVVVNAPLTGDKTGGPDYRGHTPLVFYRPGVWKRELIGEENEGVVHGLWVMDWDGDGKDEIITASFQGLHLYKRTANGWSRVQLTPGNPGAWPKGGSSDVTVGQLRKTRFLAAIEPWHGNEVAVYRPAKKGWERQVIDNTLVDGHTVIAADLNKDRLDEIIGGFRGKGHTVYVYYARDAGGRQWTRTALDNGGMGAAACVALDLNGDGKTDIACTGSATANLKWYENKGW